MNQIKVKCPLCNYIQEIPDSYTNKKIKCRKCYKQIEAKPYLEQCENCGRNIGALEKPYIYQGQHIVCDNCYAILTKQAIPNKDELESEIQSIRDKEPKNISVKPLNVKPKVSTWTIIGHILLFIGLSAVAVITYSSVTNNSSDKIIIIFGIITFWSFILSLIFYEIANEITKKVISKQLDFICTHCGHIGHPENMDITIVEILLWLFLLPLGIVYTVWRITTKCNVCPACKKVKSMIPVSTPQGQKLYKQAYSAE